MSTPHALPLRRRRPLPLRLAAWFVVAAALLATGAREAAADSWIFQQSYYSHVPAQHVQVGPRITGGPFFTRPQGAYVNSGFRRLHSTIRGGGGTFDNLNVFETWIQYGEQF